MQKSLFQLFTYGWEDNTVKVSNISLHQIFKYWYFEIREIEATFKLVKTWSKISTLILK